MEKQRANELSADDAARIEISRRIAKRYMQRHRAWIADTATEDELTNVAYIYIRDYERYFNHAVPIEYFRLRLASCAIMSFIAVAKCPVHFRTFVTGRKLIGKAIGMKASCLETEESGFQPTIEVEIAAAANQSVGDAMLKEAVCAAVRTELGIFASMSENNMQAMRYMLKDDRDERLSGTKDEIKKQTSLMNGRRAYWVKKFKDNSVFAHAFDYVLE